MNRKYAIEPHGIGEAARVDFMVKNMEENRAYTYARDISGDPDGTLLEEFRIRYKHYRESWRKLPREAIQKQLTGDSFKQSGIPPLCLDIEVAAICDLACPFCYRQFVATPDKLMSDELARHLIDQASELSVPSIKFNWRGEPLLNPRLSELINYAKRKGILETIINTNATQLTEAVSKQLIDAGLDLLIYSFDGGSKESYEEMRPGRFRRNDFGHVYNNIVKFSQIRELAGSSFPRTKIQMILTEKTFNEQQSFLGLFSGYVDEVSVKQYTERGGHITEFDDDLQKQIKALMDSRGLHSDTPVFRSKDGAIHAAVGRLPCEQLYQRLLVTYDGRVGMCCYDWGAQHPIGYVDNLAINSGDNEYIQVIEQAKLAKKGFIPLKNVRLPNKYNDPPNVTQPLSDIWTGSEINSVRSAHLESRVNDVPVCKQCPFKETYSWEVLN
jgi:molybdenum cofactor biosynthesis enzyme MoaA